MTIPNDLRVPFMYVEFDPTRAFQGPSILKYNCLIIGQRLSGGTRAALKLDKITSYDQANNYYGQGSQLARMVRAWRANNRISDLYCISLDDASAGVKATGSFVFGGTATANGSIALYIGGTRVAIAVVVGDTATQVGDKLVSAIASTLPVTGSNSSGNVTLTAKNAGEAGNDIYLDANYNDTENLPEGITLSVTQMSGGSNNPDIQDAIDLIGDTWYQVICAPYYDAANLTAIETELSERFGPLRMIDGLYVTSRRGSVGALETFGNSRNSPHVCCMHSNAVLTSSMEFASSVAAQLALEGQADPARPFQTLPLNGIVPPREEDRFTLQENNSLLYDGISTFYVDTGGVVRIQRAITMYQKNALGADDIAYLDVNTMLTLLYLRYDFRTQILSRYPRAKLANDNVQVGPGQQVMTPSLGKAEAINIFRGWETLGLVENVAQFKNDLVCVRSTTDPNRLEWILPPDLINQFRIGSAAIQFLLEAPSF